MAPSGSGGERRGTEKLRMKRVGHVPKAALENGAMVRLPWPPFHVLVSLVQGVPCAIEDACNHAGASLSEGDRLDDQVVCPMHGYCFDLSTGELVDPEGLCNDQRRLVAELDGDDVVVWDPGAGVTIVGA
jgi:nitrite reductase/ring-hydroxylating ferredoxin subunit